VTPAGDGSEASPAAQPDANAPPAAENTANGTAATGTADSAPKTDATSAGAGQTADAAKADASKTQEGTQNGTKESTSKKKKGLRKIVPCEFLRRGEDQENRAGCGLKEVVPRFFYGLRRLTEAKP